MAGWIAVKVYPNEPAAMIAQAILEGGGVHSIVSRDDGGGAMPNLQFVGGVRLLVAEEDVAAAVELLEDAEE